jgi:hypothetical protein
VIPVCRQAGFDKLRIPYMRDDYTLSNEKKFEQSVATAMIVMEPIKK